MDSRLGREAFPQYAYVLACPKCDARPWADALRSSMLEKTTRSIINKRQVFALLVELDASLGSI